MKSKLAMSIYMIFAVLSFLFGVKMFEVGDYLRGILFMVAVACWVMCIYNNGGMNKRQKQRMEGTSIPSKKSKNLNKNKKS